MLTAAMIIAVAWYRRTPGDLRATLQRCTIVVLVLVCLTIATTGGCSLVRHPSANKIPATGKPSLPADSGNRPASSAKKSPGNTIPAAKDVGL